MTHKHHIIPRHMGGSDDASNIVELTIKEHAEAHRLLFEQYGKQEDRLACLCLLGAISKEEIIKKKCSIGGQGNKGKLKTKEHKEKISKALSGAVKGPMSPELREKISKSAIGNKNSENHGSDEYRKKQKEVMKQAWVRRKQKQLLNKHNFTLA